MKRRLDLILLEEKKASTRTKAQELIRSGLVSVNGKVCVQPGADVPLGAKILLSGEEHPYVSRGGLKLAAALDAFDISVQGLRALDVGQSTGGFTHCLLMRGAAEIVGVEVGHGQLAEPLRNDPRVKCLERQDIRSLPPETLRPPFQLCVVDLSFISLRLVISALPYFLGPGAHAILLVKPQFEVGPDKVGSGGVVREDIWRIEAKLGVEEACLKAGFTVAGAMESPIEGGDGNREFLLHLRWPSS